MASLWNVKVEGCTAAEDLEFDSKDNKRPDIKKGEPLKDLFYREKTKDYVLMYGPWYLLPASAVNTTNKTMPNKNKRLLI